jgi:hypothetical protein
MLVEFARLRAVNPVTRIDGFDLSPFNCLRNASDTITSTWPPNHAGRSASPSASSSSTFTSRHRQRRPTRPHRSHATVAAIDDGSL